MRVFASALALIRPTTAIGISTAFPKSLLYDFDENIQPPAIIANTSHTQTFFVVYDSTVFDLVVILLLFVLLMILLLFWLYSRYVKTNCVYFTIEIGNKDMSVRIRYFQLYSAVYMYHFQAAAGVDRIHVTSFGLNFTYIG